MPEVTLRQNDVGSPIEATLEFTNDDGEQEAKDLTGAAVRFKMRPLEGGDLIVDAEAEVDQTGPEPENPTRGMVHYEPVAGDVDTPGRYIGEWQVTFSGGEIQTYPNDGYLLITITAEVEDAPALDLLADASLLEARLGVRFTSEEHVRATVLLGLASGLVRNRARQHLSLVAEESYERRGTPETRIRLPERPVTEITSVAINDSVIDADEYLLDGDYLERVLGWETENDTITIVYSHGYASLPQVIQTVCLEAVCRVWVNPGNVQSEQYGSESIRYRDVAGLLLTDAEGRAVEQALGALQGVGSVVLR